MEREACVSIHLCVCVCVCVCVKLSVYFISDFSVNTSPLISPLHTHTNRNTHTETHTHTHIHTDTQTHTETHTHTQTHIQIQLYNYCANFLDKAELLKICLSTQSCICLFSLIQSGHLDF